MANPRRSQKVSQQIMREVSTLILTDKRARYAACPTRGGLRFLRLAACSSAASPAGFRSATALCRARIDLIADLGAPLRSSVMSPELRLGADSSISTVTSITDVVVTGDLQIAKIYVSFFGAVRR